MMRLIIAVTRPQVLVERRFHRIAAVLCGIFLELPLTPVRAEQIRRSVILLEVSAVNSRIVIDRHATNRVNGHAEVLQRGGFLVFLVSPSSNETPRMHPAFGVHQESPRCHHTITFRKSLGYQNTVLKSRAEF